jgi:hypothetical protein
MSERPKSAYRESRSGWALKYVFKDQIYKNHTPKVWITSTQDLLQRKPMPG